MAKHWVGQSQATIQHHELHGVNARLPTGTAMRRSAEGFNYVSCQQKKVVFARFQPFGAVTGGSSAAIYAWPCLFRSGENTTGLEVFAGVTKTNFGAVSPPNWTIYVKNNGTGVADASANIYYDGATGTGSVAANSVHHHRFSLTGLSANTLYRVENQLTQGMTLVYMVIREAQQRHADDSVTGVCNPAKYVTEGPIYDEHVQDLVDANNNLWKHNAGHIYSWSCDYEAQSAGAGYPTLGAAPFANQFFNVYSRTVRFPLANRTTRRRSTVPVVIGVLGERASGTGTTIVRFTDGTNSIACTSIGAGSQLVWTTTAGTLPAADADFRIQYSQSNVSTTFRLYGVSLFQYET